MARNRSATVLFLVGFFWLLIAVIWGYTLYSELVQLPNLLAYGLCALIAGMLIGRGIQQVRANRAAKRARLES